jgi:hypothetical protein
VQKKLKRRFVAALVLGVSLLSHTSTESANSQSQQSATASFVSHDSSGCIVSETSVFVSKSAENGEQLELRMLRVDECKERGLASVHLVHNLPTGSFKLKPNLAMAVLNATLLVEEKLSGRKSPITIRLTWEAQEAMVSSTTLDRRAGLGHFKHSDSPVWKSLRMSDALGTVTFNRATVTLRSTDSSWIEAWTSN